MPLCGHQLPLIDGAAPVSGSKHAGMRQPSSSSYSSGQTTVGALRCALPARCTSAVGDRNSRALVEVRSQHCLSSTSPTGRCRDRRTCSVAHSCSASHFSSADVRTPSQTHNADTSSLKCNGRLQQQVICSCSSGKHQLQYAALTRRHALLLGLPLLVSGLLPARPSTAAAFASPNSPSVPELASRLSEALSIPLPYSTPEPVKFPRKALDQRFAVLLMRSSYDAVDALDFIPMQDFQV